MLLFLESSCEDPGKIKNGNRTFVGLHINSTVNYTCDEGYELRGKSTLLCLESGKWDLDKLPICKFILHLHGKLLHKFVLYSCKYEISCLITPFSNILMFH